MSESNSPSTSALVRASPVMAGDGKASKDENDILARHNDNGALILIESRRGGDCLNENLISP